MCIKPDGTTEEDRDRILSAVLSDRMRSNGYKLKCNPTGLFWSETKKPAPNNYHLNMMTLTVKIHLEKEPNQKEPDEGRTKPLQSQGRRAQGNSVDSFPCAGCYRKRAVRARLQRRIISWQGKGETVILIMFASFILLHQKG
ncbi:hypothetical protein QYF61_017617 [Mycteria americana]|uniref:Uncharacterized protein n=1 Tax=Mycteria americana TaxID=33587 RepID=A0AAN7NI74_MYCAM|nr:hypothetical protein QYF61_017617 [Mycteria americana]